VIAKATTIFRTLRANEAKHV